ncbi:MAG: hypothetical protein WC250_02380 [Candidatus Paceibacterota bacterium]|jgi:uncharacterized membrane protein
MNNKPVAFRLVLMFSVAGLLFAGYLSGVKLFTSTCAFNETCPYFLGYPACWYGFAMYSAMTILAVLVWTGKMNVAKGLNSILGVSILGIIFAGYFSLIEMPRLLSGGFTAYVLGLPTCVLGLIFYILILICVLITKKKVTDLTIGN